VDFDMDTIMQFKDKLAMVKRAIKEDQVFAPVVGLSKQCKWCAWRFGCDAYNAKKSQNAEKKESKLDLEYTGSIMDL
jgi:hypothetical protein